MEQKDRSSGGPTVSKKFKSQVLLGYGWKEQVGGKFPRPPLPAHLEDGWGARVRSQNAIGVHFLDQKAPPPPPTCRRLGKNRV